jgi:hypothetical protein
MLLSHGRDECVMRMCYGCVLRTALSNGWSDYMIRIRCERQPMHISSYFDTTHPKGA